MSALKDQEWRVFCEKSRLLMEKKEDLNWADVTSNYNDGLKCLSLVLTKANISSLKNAFRQYRYRNKNKMSTIYINEGTLLKLSDIKVRSRLDSYDEVFEYIFSKEDDMGFYIRKHVEEMGSPSYISDRKMLMIILKAMPYEYRKIMVNSLLGMLKAGFNHRITPDDDFKEFMSTNPICHELSELLDDI